MAGGLPEPVLLSEIFHLDHIVIAGQTVEFRHVFYTWIAMLILFVVGWVVRRNVSIIPGKLQSFFEMLIDGLENFTVTNLGEKDGRRVYPVLIGLFLIIATENLLGLLPAFDAPTANVNTNIGMALFVFLLYNYEGIKRWRFHYVHHFMGPMLPLAPFMMILEFISHLARPLSLTLRLFGNIRGEEIVLVLFFLMAPFVSTIPIYFLFLLAKVLQAFIFYMLTMIYLKGALEPAH
ncbi:MAG: F0F1 ATP synthase subunit A [Desulfovibrionaceae bacterium]|nr:F0F1 ATP synthase subunit A [Desulfovibrionaceae bacterium]